MGVLRLSTIRSRLRRALAVPFPVDRRDEPPFVDFKLISTHSPVVPSGGIEGHDTAMIAFRSQHWEFRDFVATIEGPVLLDTGQGWVVRNRKLLDVGNWSLLAQLPDIVKPSILRWAKALLTAQRVGPAVWLPFGAGNYWHFLNDMVAGLSLLDKRRDLSKCVVLVSEELAAKAFFKEVVALSSRLSALNWRTYRHDRWLRSPYIHVAGTSFGSHSTFRRAVEFLDRLPPITHSGDQRIFITRPVHNARTASNLFALSEALSARGFKVVDFEGMSVVQQRELINSASTIVAIHGAGLANLAFHERPETVKLFEITPADYLNPCFAYMAEEAGMTYFCFAGGPLNHRKNAHFDVPLTPLLDALDLFLTQD